MNYSWIAYEQVLQALPRYISPECEEYKQLCCLQSALRQNIEQAHLHDSPELSVERKVLVIALNNLMKQAIHENFIDICISINPVLKYCMSVYQVIQNTCALFSGEEIWDDSYQNVIQQLRQEPTLNGIARDRSDLSVSLHYIYNHTQQLLSMIEDFEEYCLPNSKSSERGRNKQAKIYEKLREFVGEVYRINHTYFKEFMDIWQETTSATAGVQFPHVSFIELEHSGASSVIGDVTEIRIQPLSVAQIDAIETEIQFEEAKNASAHRSAVAEFQVNLTSLREAIVGTFGEDDLKILCTDISQSLRNNNITYERIRYDSLPGSANPGKVHSLIEYCEQRGWLTYLVQEVRRARPNLVF